MRGAPSAGVAAGASRARRRRRSAGSAGLSSSIGEQLVLDFSGQASKLVERLQSLEISLPPRQDVQRQASHSGSPSKPGVFKHSAKLGSPAKPALHPEAQRERHGVALIRSYESLLAAASAAANDNGSSSKAEKESGELIAICFSELLSAKRFLPLRPLQIETLWINTLRVLERKKIWRRAWELAKALVQQLAVVDIDSPSDNASAKEYLLARACLSSASIASSCSCASTSVDTSIVGAQELEDLIQIFYSRALTWALHSSSKDNKSASSEKLSPGIFFAGLLRCAVALPRSCHIDIASRCWCRVISAVGVFSGSNMFSLADGTTKIVEALKRQRGLCAEDHPAFLQKLWRSRPLLLPETHVWAHIAELAAQAAIQLDNSILIVEEALAQLDAQYVVARLALRLAVVERLVDAIPTVKFGEVVAMESMLDKVSRAARQAIIEVTTLSKCSEAPFFYCEMARIAERIRSVTDIRRFCDLVPSVASMEPSARSHEPPKWLTMLCDLSDLLQGGTTLLERSSLRFPGMQNTPILRNSEERSPKRAKSSATSARCMRGACDLLCLGAWRASSPHIDLVVAPRLSGIMRALLAEKRTGEDLLGVCSSLRRLAEQLPSNGAGRDAVTQTLRELLKGLAQTTVPEQDSSFGTVEVSSELSASLSFCLARTSNSNALCWATRLVERVAISSSRLDHGPSGRRAADVEAAVQNMVEHCLVARLVVLQEVQQKQAQATKQLSVSEATEHMSVAIHTHLLRLLWPAQQQPASIDTSLQPFVDVLSQNISKSAVSLPVPMPWRASLCRMELQALEAVRFGHSSCGSVCTKALAKAYPRDTSALAGLLFYQATLHSSLLDSAGRAPGAAGLRAYARDTAGLARFVLSLVRGGRLAKNADTHLTPSVQTLLKTTVRLLERAACSFESDVADLEFSTYVELGRLRALQAEVSMLLPSSSHDIANHAVQALNAWSHHQGFESIDKAIAVDSLVPCLGSIGLRESFDTLAGWAHFVQDLADFASLLELLERPLLAARALGLAIVCLNDSCAWTASLAPSARTCVIEDPYGGSCVAASSPRPQEVQPSVSSNVKRAEQLFELQLQYRLVAALSQAGTRGGASVASACGVASRRWWAVAEAARARILCDPAVFPSEQQPVAPVAPSNIPRRALHELWELTQAEFALETHRLEASTSLLALGSAGIDTSEVRSVYPGQAPLQAAWRRCVASVQENTEGEAPSWTFILGAHALQASSERSSRWQSVQSSRTRRCGESVVAAQCASMRALDLLRQHGDRACSRSCAALHCKTPRWYAHWPSSRCALLQLRVFFQLGTCYERVGAPHWADYYFECGLRIAWQAPSGAAVWRLRFLCAEGRLALGGFNPSRWPATGALLSEIVSLWNEELGGATKLMMPSIVQTSQSLAVRGFKAAVELKSVDVQRSEMQPQMPAELLDLWVSAALCQAHDRKEAQSSGSNSSSSISSSSDCAGGSSEPCQIPDLHGASELFHLILGDADVPSGKVAAAICEPTICAFGLSQLAHLLWRSRDNATCSKRYSWRLCASQIASAISEDPERPLHSSLCAGLLGIADLCGQMFWQATLGASQDVAQEFANALEGCACLLQGNPGCVGLSAAQRVVVRTVLLRLGSTGDGGASTDPTASHFEAALLLSAAALRCGAHFGHSALVRQAARNLTSLSLEVSNRLVRSQLSPQSLKSVEEKPTGSMFRQLLRSWRTTPSTEERRSPDRDRSRSPVARKKLQPTSTSSAALCRDLAYQICAAAVPMCSGVSVFFLAEVRDGQRASDSGSSCAATDRAPLGMLQKHTLLDDPPAADGGSGFCDGTWLADLPSDITVAWVQLDRSRRTLQISRAVHGSERCNSGVSMVSRRISLDPNVFQQVEERFRNIHEENRRNVIAHLKTPEPNSESGKRVYWTDRQRFDSQICDLAFLLQAVAMKEWRFLLSPWPRDEEVSRALVGMFREWLESESANGPLIPANEVSHFLLMLLYSSACEMRINELSRALGDIMLEAGAPMSKSDELDELAVSLQRHRCSTQDMAAAQPCSPSSRPLLLFVDSTLSQLPLEVCPSLWKQEVVRAVAPNLVLSASRRRRKRTSTPESGYFALNPFGDADFTGQGLQALCERLKARSCSAPSSEKALSTAGDSSVWSGHVGRPGPSSAQVDLALGSRDMFVFLGHGKGGKTLLKSEKIQMGAPVLVSVEKPVMGRPTYNPLRSVVLLMGCSSTRVFRPVGNTASPPSGPSSSDHALRFEYPRGDEIEVFGMPFDVLIGGGPAMLGPLWDVLGVDLDKFATAFLEHWTDDKKSGLDDSRSMMGCLHAARGACFLPYLTAASVVCYGIPL